MIAWLRTILFRIVFYGGSVPIVASVPISALFGQRAVIVHAFVWTTFHRWTTRILLGIQVRVEGERPTGPAFYVCKHQAMFETIELQLMLDGPAIVLKRELTKVPLWGWAAQRYGAIVADRDANAAALRSMMRDAVAARKAGRSVLIFPEGTRVAPGEQPPLKAGFAGLYRMLAMPTVPIACDSARVWPRRGAKRAGVVTFRFGDVIAPGLPRAEIEARVHAAINALDRSTDEPGSPIGGQGRTRPASRRDG